MYQIFLAVSVLLVVLGSGASAQNVAPDACRNAAFVSDTELVFVPGVGNVTARVVVIEKNRTVSEYWRAYASVGHEIQAETLYFLTVRYLNPQISDINRICAGFLIHLPATADLKVVVDHDFLERKELVIRSLREEVTQTKRSSERFINFTSDLVNDLNQQTSNLQKNNETLRDQNERLYGQSDKLWEQLYKSDKKTKRLNKLISILVLILLCVVFVLIVVLLSPLRSSRRKLPKIENLRAPVRPAESFREDGEKERSEILTERAGHVPFTLHNGTTLLLEAVEVVAPCGFQLETPHILQDHFASCEKCVTRNPLPYDSFTPRGYMPYNPSDNGVDEAIKVVSARALCGVVVKMRNMEKHVKHCTSGLCHDAYGMPAMAGAHILNVSE